MATTSVNFSNAKSMDIPLASLIVDTAFNSRTNVDGNAGSSTSVQNVADSLLATGQLTPILVERRVVGKAEKYYLISGFRRVAAATKLGWDTIAARVFDVMPEAQRRILNVVENSAREDLSSYDLAMACVGIARAGGTSTEIAAKIGKSDSYVRALLGIIQGTAENKNHATPAVLRRWMLECSPEGKGLATVCSTDWLASTCKLDAEAQDKALAARFESKAKKGDPNYVPREGNGEGGTGEAGDKPKVVKGVGKIAMENARLILAEKTKVEKDVTRRGAMMVAIDTLRWALGHEDHIGEILSKDDKLAV